MISNYNFFNNAAKAIVPVAAVATVKSIIHAGLGFATCMLLRPGINVERAVGTGFAFGAINTLSDAVLDRIVDQKKLNAEALVSYQIFKKVVPAIVTTYTLSSVLGVAYTRPEAIILTGSNFLQSCAGSLLEYALSE